MPSSTSSITLSPVVKIKGTTLDAKWSGAISELRVERQLQVPGRLTLRFVDAGYVLSASAAIKLSDSISVSDSEGTALITAEVVSIGVDQQAGDQPELVVIALDAAHKLARTTSISVFEKMTYSDIVSKLLRDAALESSVDATDATLDYLMQADSGLGLISELAHRIGYDWWVDVDGRTVNFKKPIKKDPAATLDASTDLKSFSVRAAGVRPSSVTVEGWDKDTLATLRGAASSTTAPMASSDLADLAAGSPAGDIVTNGLGVGSQNEADTLAQAIYDRASFAAVTARGTVAGVASRVDIGGTVAISNAGPLSGTYPVTAVEHVYRPRSGFVTRFSSGDRHPSSLVDALGHGGGSPTYAGSAHIRSGMAIGVVTNIKDPENKGRVRVRLSGTDSSSQTDWARVVAVGGGAKRGGVWIPEVDDEVLVAFEGSDSRQPVVIGGLYGRNTMPDTVIKEGKLQTRTFTSGLGHVVGLYDGDEPADQAIRMVLAGSEHSLMLSKEKLAATVPSGTPVEIVAGDTSVKITKAGDITLQGTNITIKATAQIKLQATEISVAADSKLDMKGQGQANLAGAQVQVQGEAVTKIAGAIVQIN